jgi:D-3-phosphoglycerate dehydrogenase
MIAVYRATGRRRRWVILNQFGRFCLPTYFRLDPKADLRLLAGQLCAWTVTLCAWTVTMQRQERHVSSTVFADGRPRIVNIKGIRMDAEFGPSMIYITNLDKPGFIGRFSSTLGDAGINVATFHVVREAPGGNAIALIEVDGEVPADVLKKVQALPQVQQAKPLRF